MSIDRDLRFFVAVAQAGNLTQAGARLGVSTATISKRLGRLEQRLGARLAVRDARGFSLTEAGQHFFERSRHLSDEINRLERELADWSQRAATSLRIGVSDGIYDRLLAPVLASFSEEYPEISIELVVSGHAARPVEQGLDCLFLTGHPDDLSARLARTALCAAPLVTFAAPDYLDRAGAPVHPSELSAHACLVAATRRATKLSNWHFQRGAERLSVRVRPRATALGWQVRDLALRGLGIARLPRHLVEREIGDGRLSPVLADWCDADLRYVHLLHQPEPQLIAGLDAFISHVKRRFDADAASGLPAASSS
jgi:DNA-binding transcriptional LysR family regulator